MCWLGATLCSRLLKGKDIEEQVVLKRGDVLTVPHYASDLLQELEFTQFIALIHR